MLDQVLATFTEGAVFYLGVPLLHKLCRILGSVSKDMLLLTCALPSWLSVKKSKVESCESREGLGLNVLQQRKVQSGSCPLLALSQRCRILMLDDENKGLCLLGWSHVTRNIAKSYELNKVDLAPVLIHNSDVPCFNFSAQCNMAKGLYHHLENENIFTNSLQVSHERKMMSPTHTSLQETSQWCKMSEMKLGVDCNVHSLQAFPDDMFDLDEISITDCIYNQKGQLVSMNICFNISHSDTSSVASSEDLAFSDSGSDCEDFIVFESSCSDEDLQCTEVGFMCELHQDTCTKSQMSACTFHHGDAMMERKMEALEISQPNMETNNKEYVFKRNSSTENEKSNDSSVSIETNGNTKKKKKVHFMPDDHLVTIHQLFVWKFAYRQARKGTCEANAWEADRLRFKRRVMELEEILTPVLLAKRRKFERS